MSNINVDKNIDYNSVSQKKKLSKKNRVDLQLVKIIFLKFVSLAGKHIKNRFSFDEILYVAKYPTGSITSSS